MNDSSGGEREGEMRSPLAKPALENVEPNLQPVACVGGEERTAEHQDAAQNIFLGHLEGRGRSMRAENNPEVDKGSAVGNKGTAAGPGEGC